MILLERFFKPKTQKNDPQTRLKRLQNLSSDDPVLAEFAQQDADQDVRCAAVKRLTDLQLLQRISQTDTGLAVTRSRCNALPRFIGRHDHTACVATGALVKSTFTGC